MTSTTKSRMDVVKREEKEGKLKDFISNYLATNAAPAGQRPWQLIARSVESPVVMALAALAPEIKAAGCDIETLLTCNPANVADTATTISLGFPGELRLSRDPRLLDAHEQLCLDASSTWIGDCMRREPAKRDGFERYATGCTETATWAQRAFERMWLHGEPAMQSAMTSKVAEAAGEELEAAVPPAGAPVSTIVVSTRH